MKNQALFSLKDKSKKLKCRLLQFLFGALRVKICIIIPREVCIGLGSFELLASLCIRCEGSLFFYLVPVYLFPKYVYVPCN